MGKIYYVVHTKSYNEREWNSLVITKHKLEELKILFKNIDSVDDKIILYLQEKTELEQMENYLDILSNSLDFRHRNIVLDSYNKTISMNI